MSPHSHLPEQTTTRWRPRIVEFVKNHARQIALSLAELVKIASISGSDEENAIQSKLAHDLAKFDLEVDHWEIPLESTLTSAGFPGVEVERREAWGLVGCAHGAGGGRSLMLNGHVDVVPPGTIEAWGRQAPFSGEIGDGYVWGRGSCDMKGGLVAALWAMRTLIELKVPLAGDLVLACVQGEEDGGLGTFATLARGWRADACVIPEPTSLDLVPAAAGSLTFRLHVRGQACHASRRTAGVSAIEKFLPVFEALRQLESRRNVGVHPLMSGWDIAYPIEIGTIRCGDWPSSVPDSLIAEGRYGVALGETIETAKRQFEDAVRIACDGDTWLHSHPVAVEWWGGQFAPGMTNVDSPIVTSLAKVHSLVSERRQRVWGAPYGSDLRLTTGLGGMPTVHYGPGDVGLAHGPRERIAIEEVLVATRTLALLAVDYCSGS